MKILRLPWLFAFSLCCVPARTQATLIPISRHAIQGAPFTLTIETRQAFSRVPRIHVSTQRILRDSAGRQRYESRVEEGVTLDATVRLYDVVAGKEVELNLDAKTSVVRPMQLGNAVRIDLSTANSPLPSSPEPNQTLLGTDKIAGLEAWGQRTLKSVTRPDGSSFTQDRELWTSTRYGIPLLEVTRRESGTTTQTVVSFDPAEPEPALFQVPAGFAVTDAPPPPQPAPGTMRIGGAVSAPIVLKQVPPEFTEQARYNKVSGNVLVHLIVDEKGRPQQVTVVKSIGSGLDEKAVEAVQKYRFKPAMENGKPVKVEMNISVNFQIF